MQKEYFLQQQFSQWLDSQDILYCASCGGMRTSIGTAVKMKRSGYKKGFPDIAIYESRGCYRGLFIELKADAGKPTPEQLGWQESLNARGYLAVIQPSGMSFVEGFDWLRKVVQDYMSGHISSKGEVGPLTCELCGQFMTVCKC